jgi:GxxExxY protein
MDFESLSDQEEQVARAIVDSAFVVHRTLGPGLLESIYEACLCHELTKRGFTVRRQVAVPIQYDGIVFPEGLRLDVLVNELVICELKAADSMNPLFQAQLLSQLRLTGRRLGFLINFNVKLIKNGIQRIIL